jgi:hypothetical protein
MLNIMTMQHECAEVMHMRALIIFVKLQIMAAMS